MTDYLNMKIAEHPLVTKYYFTSTLDIDDYMNVTVDTKEFDKFMLLLESHNITHDKLHFTKFVEGNKEVIVGVSVADFLHTEELKYDILTFMMENQS